MIQTPKSATDHQIAILQSLANSGIRQFAAGGKARAFGDSAGQEIGEAERKGRGVGIGFTPFEAGRQGHQTWVGLFEPMRRRVGFIRVQPH